MVRSYFVYLFVWSLLGRETFGEVPPNFVEGLDNSFVSTYEYSSDPEQNIHVCFLENSLDVGLGRNFWHEATVFTLGPTDFYTCASSVWSYQDEAGNWIDGHIASLPTELPGVCDVVFNALVFTYNYTTATPVPIIDSFTQHASNDWNTKAFRADYTRVNALQACKTAFIQACNGFGIPYLSPFDPDAPEPFTNIDPNSPSLSYSTDQTYCCFPDKTTANCLNTACENFGSGFYTITKETVVSPASDPSNSYGVSQDACCPEGKVPDEQGTECVDGSVVEGTNVPPAGGGGGETSTTGGTSSATGTGETDSGSGGETTGTSTSSATSSSSSTSTGTGTMGGGEGAGDEGGSTDTSVGEPSASDDGFCGIDDHIYYPDDCNGVCNSGDSPGSSDCDAICEPDDDVTGPDCDGFCDVGETSAVSDCDGSVCDEYDEFGSVDCNGHCSFSDHPGSPDCDQGTGSDSGGTGSGGGGNSSPFCKAPLASCSQDSECCSGTCMGGIIGGLNNGSCE